MRRTVTATEAETRLAELLRRVEKGDVVVITRHGRPVAALVGTRDLERLERLRGLGSEDEPATEPERPAGRTLPSPVEGFERGSVPYLGEDSGDSEL